MRYLNNYEKGECKNCDREAYIVNKSLQLCNKCNDKRLGDKKRGQPREMSLFDRIYAERGGVSQISGKKLPEKGDSRYHWCFSHILTKGAYPKFKLKPENIKLVTPEEHILWENYKWKVRELPEWKWVFDMQEQLKQQYFAN